MQRLRQVPIILGKISSREVYRENTFDILAAIGVATWGVVYVPIPAYGYCKSEC